MALLVLRRLSPYRVIILIPLIDEVKNVGRVVRYPTTKESPFLVVNAVVRFVWRKGRAGLDILVLLLFFNDGLAIAFDTTIGRDLSSFVDRAYLRSVIGGSSKR